MSILKCEMCGGTLVLEENGTVAVCEYCGTRIAATNSEISVSSVNSANNSQSQNNHDTKVNTLRIENERRKTEEAKARAQEARLKAESQRLERERLAEQKRIEKSKRGKEIRKKILKAFLAVSAVIALGIFTITVIVPTVRYNGALKDVEEKNYEEAYLTFKSLYKFKDSQSQADALLRNYPGVAQIGDIIYLGKYEQDNKTSNGKEEIEWRVLDKDENGKMLVISKNALDSRTYHSSVGEVTWETSDIRKWLNNEFYSTAFNKTERATVKTVTLENTDNSDYKTDGGNNTNDKIFLLSIDEAKRYMPTALERVCIGTKYSQTQGSELDSLTRTCRWWLRSPGSTLYNASFVKIDGFILQFGSPVSIDKCAVRPAMWVQF